MANGFKNLVVDMHQAPKRSMSRVRGVFLVATLLATAIAFASGCTAHTGDTQDSSDQAVEASPTLQKLALQALTSEQIEVSYKIKGSDSSTVGTARKVDGITIRLIPTSTNKPKSVRINFQERRAVTSNNQTKTTTQDTNLNLRRQDDGSFIGDLFREGFVIDRGGKDRLKDINGKEVLDQGKPISGSLAFQDTNFNPSLSFSSAGLDSISSFYLSVVLNPGETKEQGGDTWLVDPVKQNSSEKNDFGLIFK